MTILNFRSTIMAIFLLKQYQKNPKLNRPNLEILMTENSNFHRFIWFGIYMFLTEKPRYITAVQRKTD